MPKGKKKGFADPSKISSDELTKLWDQLYLLEHTVDREWVSELAKKAGYKPFYERSR